MCSAAWDALTSAQEAAFEATLPFNRNGAAAPTISGYLSQDRTYSAGGRALDGCRIERLTPPRHPLSV
ncbi:hypothetical protein [Caulobacter sp. 602-1]|uniref:HORMA-1 domain-containing protein n=1 Tax=Caulobacter sp. 602-1 TaxID=2492472 RepID=UPI00131540B2